MCLGFPLVSKENLLWKQPYLGSNKKRRFSLASWGDGEGRRTHGPGQGVAGGAPGPHFAEVSSDR